MTVEFVSTFQNRQWQKIPGLGGMDTSRWKAHKVDGRRPVRYRLAARSTAPLNTLAEVERIVNWRARLDVIWDNR